jgi:ubiquinone/menaquinone biosynthesis C-methylase UbiE
MPGVELCAADTVTLPYRSGVFDAAISIAVLHHLSSHQRRLAALTEMLRILRVGGKLLVYVWAQEQGKEVYKTVIVTLYCVTFNL